MLVFTHVRVRAPWARQARFWEACRTEDAAFSFCGILPRPAEGAEHAPWGTELDADEVQLDVQPDRDENDVWFVTQTTEPRGWIKAALGQFPDLGFMINFFEEGSRGGTVLVRGWG